MTNNKEFISVKTAALKTGLSEHTLRYYERIGLLDPIKRSKSGHRNYSPEDIGWVEFLKCLRATGMPIEMMKLYMDFQRSGDNSFENRLGILKNHKIAVLKKIKELKKFLETIDYKIGFYGNLMEEAKNGKDYKEN